MSGRRSKNQKLGSSRRGPKGFSRNIEKDEDGFQQVAASEQKEFHTTTDHSVQADHPPNSTIDQQTSMLECPPQESHHKDLLMESRLPERKRKMGSTRKSAGGIKVERKHEVRATEEVEEECATQLNTAAMEEQHGSLTEDVQSGPSNISSNLSLHTEGLGLERQSEPISEDVVHCEKTSFHSNEDMTIKEETVGQSVHANDVTVAQTDLLQDESVMFDKLKSVTHQESSLAKTSRQKRRVGSTRSSLGGINTGSVGVQEHFKNMTKNKRKEVTSDSKLSEDIVQTWDDVANDDPSSHTELVLPSNQSFLVERADLKDPNVSAGTEMMNQSVAFSLLGPKKPLPKISSQHGTPLLNEETELMFHSHTEDSTVANNNFNKAGSQLSDNQCVSNKRNSTSTSCNSRDVNTEEAKEEVQKEEAPKAMGSLSRSQDAQLQELALNKEESLLLCQHDSATLDNNCDLSAQLIEGGSRGFDMPPSNVSLAEPTLTRSPHEMSDAEEMKRGNNVCVVDTVACNTDLDCITEEDKHLECEARKFENMSVKIMSGTDNAFEMTDQSGLIDHSVTQNKMDVKDNDESKETSTETWILHQEPCEILAEKEELQKEHSLNISQMLSSQAQDDARKVLENEEVGEDKEETGNTATNDVTSKPEEMFSFEDTATNTGSHTHQVFMQSTVKQGHDLVESVREESEKEEIHFITESENAALGDRRSKKTERTEEIDAAPVMILDVKKTQTNINNEYNEDNSDMQTENQEQNRDLREERIYVTDANLKVSDNPSTVIECDIRLQNVVTIGSEMTFDKDAEMCPAGGDTDLEIQRRSKASDLSISEAENINNVSVELNQNTVESNMASEKSDLDFFQTTADGIIAGWKTSEKTENDVSNDLSTITKDIHTMATLKSTPAVHKQKTSSARSHLKGNKGQSKGSENQNEFETLENEVVIHVEKETFSLENEPSPDKSTFSSLNDGKNEQKNEMGEEDDVGLVEGSLCKSHLASEKCTAQSVYHITESQTLTEIHEESQENVRDAKEVTVESGTDLQLKTESENKTSYIIGKAEVSEENIPDVSVLVREVELTGNTVIVENMSNKMNDTLADGKLESLNIQDNTEEVSTVTESGALVQDDPFEESGETNTIAEQSDISITHEDTHREAHSEITPVVHKRKIGSTRRPLKGNKGLRKGREHEDENETLDSEGMISVKKENSLEYEQNLDKSTLQISKDEATELEISDSETESALIEPSCSLAVESDLESEESNAANVCHITESQTHIEIHEESQDIACFVERMTEVEDVDLHLEAHNKTFDSSIEETEPNVPDTVLGEVEVIRDKVTKENNMTNESNAEKEIAGDTDTILDQSDINTPEDIQMEEDHLKLGSVSRRKMGSTRRPLKGNTGLRKEREHEDENETLDIEGMISVKEENSLENEQNLDKSTLQISKDGATEQEICEEKDVGHVEGSESALIQPSCCSDLKSEDSTAANVCFQKNTDTILDQSDDNLKLGSVSRRKMGSTRRPLRGNKGQKRENEDYDEINHDRKEIILEDSPSPAESADNVMSFCDISESQTISKFHEAFEEKCEDVERVPADGDTETRSEIQKENKTTHTTSEAEETEIICETSVLVKEVELIGDKITLENMNSESLENATFTDSKPETFQVSDEADTEVPQEKDTISKQCDTITIFDNEVHSKLSPVVHKRKIGSTRRPPKGSKGQKKVRESKVKDVNNEAMSEEDGTNMQSEIQDQSDMVDHNLTHEIMIKRDNKYELKQKLVNALEQDQTSDASQTHTGLSHDDTSLNLLEVSERTADFVRDNHACTSHSDLFLSDTLHKKDIQIQNVSLGDSSVHPTELVEMDSVSKTSLQKKKIGSTRKRGKRMVNEEEVVEKKEVESDNTTDDGNRKIEEKLTIEEAIAGSPLHKQLFKLSAVKEENDIHDTVSKLDVQTKISEKNDPHSTTNPELLIDCVAHASARMVSDLASGDDETHLVPKRGVTSKESHGEDQTNLNPIVHKRKMGSTRKTLRGNKGQRKEEQSKNTDIESEGMTEEHETESDLARSEIKGEYQFDEEVKQIPVEFSHPVPTELQDRTDVSLKIHDLSEVSEEMRMANTGNDSSSLNGAIYLSEGTRDKFSSTICHEDVHQNIDNLDQNVHGGSESEQSSHSIPTNELQSTKEDVFNKNSSQEIPATQEKRQKMGSTRRNPRVMYERKMADHEDLRMEEDRETKKSEDKMHNMSLTSSISESNKMPSDVVSITDLESEILGLKADSYGQTGSETPANTLQICENQLEVDSQHLQTEAVTSERRRKMGSTRKNFGKNLEKRDEDTKTVGIIAQSDESEMSLEEKPVGEQPTNYSNLSEDSLLSEIEQVLNKTSLNYELIVSEPKSATAPDFKLQENSEINSFQLMPSQSSTTHSQPNSPERRRRKMGSTRKNPKQQLKAEREDEDKGVEERNETLEIRKENTNDNEKVEVSVVQNITENQLNKEYLDVLSAHTSGQQEESAITPVQEKTSPSTKRKFGSRRANKGKQGLGRLDTSDNMNQLEDEDHKPDGPKDNRHNDGLAACDPHFSSQTENQPTSQPFSEESRMDTRNMEAASKGTDAGLVSLDQIIRPDRNTSSVNLKSRISDTEVVQFNVIMVGNSCVGKTSFIRRFHEGKFSEDYRSTIGIDTCIQTVELPDRTVRLQIWDTAGQERFHSITKQVFHKADGLLLMYEISCSKSFLSVRDWMSQARERAPDDVIMILLGNKNDSVKREVQAQEGEDLAREYNIHFMECSAATGANVSESMRSLAELLMQRKKQKQEHTTLRRDEPQKKSGCC